MIEDRRQNRSASKKKDVMSQLHQVIELEQQEGNCQAPNAAKLHQNNEKLIHERPVTPVIPFKQPSNDDNESMLVYQGPYGQLKREPSVGDNTPSKRQNAN